MTKAQASARQIQLHHYSEDGTIRRFRPRAVQVRSARKPGQEWLNGPLVWAIAESHSFLYLFPRDCPRIVMWATERTTPGDRETWLGSAARVAFVQTDWMDRIRDVTLYRYILPPDTFVPLDDVGMAVSETAVTPAACDALGDVPTHLSASGVQLKTVARLKEMSHLFDTSLHVSGIRLRNAR